MLTASTSRLPQSASASNQRMTRRHDFVSGWPPALQRRLRHRNHVILELLSLRGLAAVVHVAGGVQVALDSQDTLGGLGWVGHGVAPTSFNVGFARLAHFARSAAIAAALSGSSRNTRLLRKP